MELRGELMERHSLRDAQDHLQKLIEDAQHGKIVLILDENQRAVQLVPVIAAKPRKAGSVRGQIEMAADFEAPLSDFDEYME
jgi:antitoxin (DNA-binding transcriptional repressor) of toxin-antitoxin stability system